MSNIFSKAKRTVTMYINPEFCRPKAARLIITVNCNFRCQMCTFWHKRTQDPSLKTIKYWIKELADFGIKEIDIGGGEPFLHKDLVAIIREIKSQGMKCSLTTNGWLVEKVPFPPVDSFEVSVDGAKPQTHDKIRGVKGAWERAIKAAKIARSYCPTHLNFTLQADNYLELVDYCKLVKKLGFSTSIIPVSLKLAAQPWISNKLSRYNMPLLKQQISQALKTGAILNNREFLRIFLAKIEKGPIPQQCLAPYRCVLIFTNSDVYPCGNFNLPVGNLSKGRSFKDIYRNYQKMRKEVRSGSHQFCSQCVYPDIANRQTIKSSIVPFLKKHISNKKS